MKAKNAKGIAESNDVILWFNLKRVNTLQDLLQAPAAASANTELLVFRNQKELKIRVDLSGKK